ncbi:MAG: DUF7714 family protein [Streptosporangiaceae bacterium]
MQTVVPSRYREVAFTAVDVPLTQDGLAGLLVGREAYRRTRFIVAHSLAGVALVKVTRRSDEPLFSPIIDARLLAGPAESELVTAPDADVAVPTQLGQVAARLAPSAKCVVVLGRYEHVSFILNPVPIPVRVVDVAPPYPAILADQAARMAEIAEDLPPLAIQPDVTDLAQLAARRPAERYLLPCRGSGAAPPGAQVDYLDERPPRRDWVLIGCERSRQIHRYLYGDDAPCIEMCPREIARARSHPDGPVLTRCCLLEEEIEDDGLMVVLPWGATLRHVQDGLRLLAEAVTPAWARE